MQKRPRSKWDDDREEDSDAGKDDKRRRKMEKEERKRIKLESLLIGENATPDGPLFGPAKPDAALEAESANEDTYQDDIDSIPFAEGPSVFSCRHVDSFEKLNRIDEGSYGTVYRARDKQTGEIVALKKLKLEKEQNGFPITNLREIRTLLLAKHPYIVNLREIVVGEKSSRCVSFLSGTSTPPFSRAIVF